MKKLILIALLIFGCKNPFCCQIGCPSGAELNCEDCSCECVDGLGFDECGQCIGHFSNWTCPDDSTQVSNPY